MIVGIVVIHANFTGMEIFMPYAQSATFATRLIYFFSEVVARCCVPLFFAISGYLFFKNVDRFTAGVYGRKIKGRCKSVLQPYLIWNLIGFLFLLCKKLPPFTAYFPGVADMPLGIGSFVDCFWNFHYSEVGAPMVGEAFLPGYPIDFPLWFLRDLILIQLLTPLIYAVVKLRYLNMVYMTVLGLMFVSGLAIGPVRLDGLFFFSIGAAVAILRIDFVSGIVRQWWLPWVYIAVGICDLLTCDETWNHYIHAAQILLGIGAAMYVALRCAGGAVRVSRFLIGGAFFVYVSHGLIDRIVIKLLYGIMDPVTSAMWSLCYIGTVAVLVSVPLGVYWLLNRYAPSVSRLLLGGR